MSETLLQTKLYIPTTRLDLVLRPRLIEKLSAGLDSKLTLVSAPAGFGKTTLIIGWLDQLSYDNRIAWLSLEESDSDPSRFFAYLIGALQTVHPTIGQDLTLDSPLPPLESAMLILINEITAVSRPFILVLDDYHLITTPAIHQAMDYLLAHLPTQMHLVLISRSDPTFSLSRWRVRHQMTEIRARDLRFTLDEATEFLNQTMTLALSPEEVTLLEQRTEGWIAGLQLAAHSLQLEEDSTTFLTAFAGDDRYIADYLVEEVLTHQPEKIKSFLLQTSILKRLSSPLCNDLLERQDSQSILEFLEQSNLFIVSLDNRRQWFRYHQLFADLLRDRLEASSEEVLYLHQRASQWYADNNFMPEAVEHALSSADYDEAIRLILNCAAEMFMTSQLTTLLQWWQKIPEEMATQNQKLCMIVAWAWLATGHKQESEQCLQAIEQSLARPMNALLTDIDMLRPEIRNILIEVAAIRVSYQTVAQVDVTETLAICQCILPFLVEEDDTFLFNPPIALRPVVLFNMGLAYQILGRLDEAVAAFEESAQLGKVMGNVHIVATSLGHLAEAEIVQGRLYQAAETCHRGIELLAALAGKTSPMSGLLHIRLGQLYYEWNDLESAVGRLEKGIIAAKPWRIRDTLLPGYLSLARTYRAIGLDKETQGALKALDELVADERGSTDSITIANYACYQAEQRDLEPVRRWVESTNLNLEEEPLREAEAIILVRIQLMQGEFGAAGQWLNMLLPGAESGERWGRVVELLILQAIFFNAQDDREAALKTLTRALEIAQGERYVRTFVDGGQPVAALLGEAARGVGVTEYANKVLAAFPVDNKESRGKESTAHSAAPPNRRPSSLIDPLSNRELEVLQLIAEGLTNREIAVRLHISPGTVKVHAHNIYSKLEVNGRTQAVAKARTLNILS